MMDSNSLTKLFISNQCQVFLWISFLHDVVDNAIIDIFMLAERIVQKLGISAPCTQIE